jgi:adenosylhomocysteine nucleosidase
MLVPMIRRAEAHRTPLRLSNRGARIVVLVSASTEWRAVRRLLSPSRLGASPYGEFFFRTYSVGSGYEPVLFLYGGSGKIAAAGSTQYVIDRWQPKVLVNLGTCGGIAGRIRRHTVVLVQRTVVYDIVDQMGTPGAVIKRYSTRLDLRWLGTTLPLRTKRSHILSGDRDLLAAEIPWLKKKFKAVVVDWESAAIAHVAKRNRTRLLILRGVSDLVSRNGGEAYGNREVFRRGASIVMEKLLESFPRWLPLLGRA